MKSILSDFRQMNLVKLMRKRISKRTPLFLPGTVAPIGIRFSSTFLVVIYERFFITKLVIKVLWLK